MNTSQEKDNFENNDEEKIVDNLKFSIDESLFEQLTGRNQQFIISLHNMIASEQIISTTKHAIFTEIADTLIKGQETGQTARQLYGTPSETAQLIKEQYSGVEKETKQLETPIIRGIDGGLLLGSVYVLLNGFTIMRTPELAANQALGVISLLLNYVLAVLVMMLITQVMPDFDAPKGQRGYLKYFAVSMGAMIFWVTGVNLSVNLLPTSLNPTFPYTVYYVIGLIGFGLRWYFRRRYNITGRAF